MDCVPHLVKSYNFQNTTGQDLKQVQFVCIKTMKFEINTDILTLKYNLKKRVLNKYMKMFKLFLK